MNNIKLLFSKYIFFINLPIFRIVSGILSWYRYKNEENIFKITFIYFIII